MKTEQSKMRKDWMEMKNMITLLNNGMQAMKRGGKTTEKWKSVHDTIHWRTPTSHEIKLGFLYTNKMCDRSTVKFYVPNKIA